MKKLVAIALVLAVASMANAGIAFVTSTGATTVNAGDVITVQLKSSDLAMTGGFNIGILTDFGANGTLSAPAISASLTQLGSYEVLNTAANAVKGGTSALIYNAAAYGALNTGGVAFSFSYTVPTGSSTIVIGGLPVGQYYMYSDGEAYNDGAATMANMSVAGAPTDVAIGNLTLSVVPEPMTLGLLSLGGLFLRRRLA
jgi:hypothetical protein